MHPPPPPRNTVSPPSRNPVFGAVLALVVANGALAFGPWLVRLADTGPVASAFWRIAIATPLLLAVAIGRHRAAILRLPAMLWLTLLVSGVAFAADLAAWHVGILRTTIANATLFGNSASLIFPIYGFVVARALPARGQAIALGLALAGGALLMGRSAELSPDNLVGDLLCVLAGVLYAVYFIAMSGVRARLDAVPALALSGVASVVPLLAFALVLGERILPGDWTPLILLALCSQIVGQGLMIYALGHLSPLVIGIGLLIQPAVGATIGWLAYGERLGALDLVGAALVAAALVLVRRER